MKRLAFVLTFFLIATAVRCMAQTSCADAVQVALEKEGVHFTDNNSVVLFKNGQEKFDDLFSAIRHAKESVHLEYFNFRNDAVARHLLLILSEKVREGVKVRALFDSFGNSSNNKPLKNEHMRAIRERGIEIYEFDPISFPWVNHIWARDHRKIVVIDGRVAYTGGMNVADYYINGTEQVGEWRDTHCRIEGGAVNELQRIFLTTWNKVSGQHLTGTGFYKGGMRMPMEDVKCDTTVTRYAKRVGIINREPHTSNEIMKQFYNSAINNARRSIRIVSPYFTLNRQLKKSLREALQRGVRVEIIISSRFDEPVTPDVVFCVAHKLMQCGAEVYIYKPGFHHSKIMMVDDELCTVGSTNLDARSLSYDYEENAVIIDPCTTAELNRIFDDDKKQCIFLTPEVWKTYRTPWQKFRGHLYSLLTPFL